MYEIDLPDDVRFWSHFVLLSKRIAVDKNYYKDEFIKFFSYEGVQDPLLSITSYVRVIGIRTIIETFLSEFTGKSVQFVNLGSGLDTVSLNLLSKYPNVICYDLDLEREIKTKIEILTQTNELLSFFPNYKVDSLDFYSERYHIFECDLRDVTNLEKLRKHNFSYDLPTVFLSEFVITYLENHLSNQVIKYFCDNCKSFSLFVDLEYIRPNSSFFKWFYSIISQKQTMYSLSNYSTSQLQIQRFKDLGWDGVFSCDYNFVYNNFINKHERKRLKSIENFSEMELLALYFSHPLLVVAYKHFNDELNHKFSELFKEKHTNTTDLDDLLPYLSDEYLEKERSIDQLYKYMNDFFTYNYHHTS